VLVKTIVWGPNPMCASSVGCHARGYRRYLRGQRVIGGQKVLGRRYLVEGNWRVAEDRRLTNTASSDSGELKGKGRSVLDTVACRADIYGQCLPYCRLSR
jgi:hypothetical protein